MDKPARRRECFARVKSLSPVEKSLASAKIREFIAGSPLFHQANTIFSFAALPGEPDLGELVTTHPEKRWAYPKVGDDDRLSFYTVQSGQTLSRGTLGISEPAPLPEGLQHPSTPDLIFVPGVGFDLRSLTRLGRGKGHYDRYLALVLEEKRPVTFLGVSFTIQLTALEREAHDIPMHRLVTEDGWAG
jgi:5-formyltetrahydrofolate cyclo-ligase